MPAFSEFTDEKIIEGIKSKDTLKVNKSVAALYKACQKKIMRYILDNHGNKQDAEDVTQEIIILFLHLVMKEKYTYRSDTKISTYIYVLARRNWLKKLKRKTKEELVELVLPEREIAHSENLLDDFLEAESTQIAKKLFDKLDKKHQEILEAYYDLKLSLKEIAERLDITISNAKVRKFRAIQAFKDIIK